MEQLSGCDVVGAGNDFGFSNDLSLHELFPGEVDLQATA